MKLLLVFGLGVIMYTVICVAVEIWEDDIDDDEND